MVIGVEEEPENEKGVIVVGGVSNGGEDKEGEKEKVEDDGDSDRGPIGRNLRTKAEACEYLADLSHYPSLANWLAGEAREEEARRLRRNGKNKRKGLESQAVGDGEGRGVLGRNEVLAPENGVAQIDVAEGALGSNHLREDAAFKSEDAEIQQEKVAEGAQGGNHLRTAIVLESEDADVQEEKVAEGAQGSKHLQTDADLESEDTEVQQQKVPEGAQEDKYLQTDSKTDALLESEDAEVQQQKVDDTGKGDNGYTSSFKERTEPTNHGNVQEESTSIIDLCFSCAEEVEVTVDATTEEANMNAEKDDFIDLSEQGEKVKQVENDADLERTILLEADREDIIPVKLLGLQVKKDADLERTVSLEALPMDGKDIIPLKLIRPPRYFKPQDNSEQTSSSSGEDDDNCLLREKKPKQKVCCICGRLGHDRTKCKKVNKCLFCGKKGHLAKDCPHEDIVREQTSSFCLKCANSGHDIFSCTNDYPADDLEKIQCYVCKAFGHLCCVNYGHEGPKSLSCYNCGESDHLGSECKKVQEKSSRSTSRNGKKKKKKLRENNGTPAVLSHPNAGEKGHSTQECDEKAKEVSEPILASIPNVPRLAKLPQPKNYVPRLNLPYMFGYGHQNYVPRFDSPYWYGNGPQNYIPRFNPPRGFGYGTQNYVPRFASSQGWSPGRGFNYHQQQRPFVGTLRSNVWQSPNTAAEGNKIPSPASSSQSSNQPPQ